MRVRTLGKRITLNPGAAGPPVASPHWPQLSRAASELSSLRSSPVKGRDCCSAINCYTGQTEDTWQKCLQMLSKTEVIQTLSHWGQIANTLIILQGPSQSLHFCTKNSYDVSICSCTNWVSDFMDFLLKNMLLPTGVTPSSRFRSALSKKCWASMAPRYTNSNSSRAPGSKNRLQVQHG